MSPRGVRSEEAALARVDRRDGGVRHVADSPPARRPRAAPAAGAADCSRRPPRTTCRSSRRGRDPEAGAPARRGRASRRHTTESPAARTAPADARRAPRASRSLWQRCTPAPCRSATSIAVAARRSAASRGHSRAERSVQWAYSGRPRPLPCTQMRPKLPRDARCARSPSSSTTRSAPKVAHAVRERRADEPAADDRGVDLQHRQCRREAQHRRDLRGEALVRVIAAALHVLPRAAVERDGRAVVEHFVAGLHAAANSAPDA